MGKIDKASIEGFDTMSPEQQVAALLAYEYDDGADKLKAAEESAAKLKAAVDKASSEAAGYKKQLNARMSDEEKGAAALKAMEERLAEYEKRDKINTAKAAFLAAGFDESAAEKAAVAFIGGDIEALSPALKGFRSSVETSLKAKLVDETPRPEGGGKADTTPDYTKLYEDAVKRGDMPAAASYIRLSQTQKT